MSASAVSMSVSVSIDQNNNNNGDGETRDGYSRDEIEWKKFVKFLKNKETRKQHKLCHQNIAGTWLNKFTWLEFRLSDFSLRCMVLYCIF